MANNEVFEKYRPPIVTIMGHVDHGKTSILDAIRKTNVQAGEYGGITQHIGAYQIEFQGKKITFIDTPGHAAFTNMRARGGKAADIVVLVVAADDGVQPQTKEAIQHIKNSKSKVIVAINKIDTQGADIQKAKQQLASENILVEDWGGDVVCVEVSAKTGQNLDKLLESIALVADFMEIPNLPNADLEAIIIESKKDRQKGPVVNVIVKTGILKLGQKIIASGYIAKVKSLSDDKGTLIKEAIPGTPVEIMGFKDLPSIGDSVLEEGNELAQLAIDDSRQEIIGKDTNKVISIVLRADTQGTLEAVKASLAEMVSSAVGISFSIRFLLASSGDILDSDVELASSGDGVVLGFNVKLSPAIEDLARDLGVTVKTYKTIYQLIDEVKDLLEGSAVSEEQKIKGRLQVLKTFKLPSGDMVLGCTVLAGRVKENDRIAIFEKNPSEAKSEEVLYYSSVKKVKVGRDEVEIVRKGAECGVLLKSLPEIDLKDKYLEVQ